MPDNDQGSGDWSRPSTSRRRMMALLGASGVASLAGCGGDSTDESTPTDASGGDETPTEDDSMSDEGPTETETPGEPYVSGQRLRFTTTHNPETISFLGFGGGAAKTDLGFNFAWPIYRSLAEKGATGRWEHQAFNLTPGETHWLAYDPEGTQFNIDQDPATIRVEIKDDVTWSDGTDVTAWDCVAPHMHFRLNGLSSGAQGTIYEPRETSNPVHAFDEVRMPDGRDGKVYELVDPRDIYSKFPQGWLNRVILSNWMRTMQPTHKEPITELAEESWSIWESAKDNDGNLPSGFNGSLTRLQNTVTEEDLNNWRDPDFVVSSGPWKLGEIKGAQEVVLDVNENYRHADEINFDGVVWEFADSTQRRLASMQSGRLDFLEESLTPAQAQGRPPGVEQRNVPGGGGIALEIDHGNLESPLGQREVRAAMMHAMNLGDIAGNVHPNAASPMNVPGGDNWNVEAVADQSWIDENLIDYGEGPQMDRATSLMQEAGASRNSDGIWTMDGEPLQYEVATDQSSPRFSETVASQLTEFGIDASLQTYSDTKFFNNLRNGPGFDMWRSGGMTGFYTSVASFWWGALNYNTALGEEGVRNYFPLEAEQEALEGYADNGWVAGNYNAWEDLTIEVPPIGEPDGEPQEIAAAYENGVRARGPESYSEDFYKQFLWIANYYLPVLPMVKQFTQTFYDDAHWDWPTDHNLWQYFPVNISKGKFLHTNLVDADPENPEEGATVERR